MAMLDWLQQRLTPAKAADDRWVQFAAALEQVVRTCFDPNYATLQSLQSIYEMSPDDLQKRLREFGDYYAVDMPAYDERKIGVAWRRLELQYKDIKEILLSVFRRHYPALDVDWLPLYAPKDQAYGSQLIPGDTISSLFLPPSNYWMTSRGLLEADLGQIFGLGLTKAAFLETAVPLARRVKPLHIVFDGVLFYIRVNIDFTGGKLFGLQDCVEEETFPIKFFFKGDLFDYTAADVQELDRGPIKTTYDRLDSPILPFTAGRRLPWRLDIHVHDGVGDGWIPLDLKRPGVEGEEIPDLAMLYAEKLFPRADAPCAPFVLSRAPASGVNDADVQQRYWVGFSPETSVVGMTAEKSASPVVYGDGFKHRLDMFPRFDSIPADFAPLDKPLGGFLYG